MAESSSGWEHTARPQYTEAQTRAWLSWLAKNLQRHGEVVFMIERLQPTWLERRQRAVYWFAFNLILGLLLGFVLLLGWWASEAMWKSGAVHNGFEFLILTPLWILIVGSLEGPRLRGGWRHRPRNRWKDLWYRSWEGFWDYVIWCLMFLTLWPVLQLLGLTFAGEFERLSMRWVEGADLGWMGHPMLAGLMMVVLYEVRVRTLADPRRIQPVEELVPSWRQAIVGLKWGIGLALLMWAILGVGSYLMSADEKSLWQTFGSDEVLRNFFIYLPMGGVGGAIVGGLRPRMLKKTTEPEQGISLSWQNGRWAAFWAALMLGGVFWAGITLPVLSFWPELWESRDEHPAAVVCIALVAGIAAFLWYGGLDVLRHRILRLLLEREGRPRDLVAFLEHARRLHFLQRAGGGYLFVHRYLMEHFAEREGRPAEGAEWNA